MLRPILVLCLSAFLCSEASAAWRSALYPDNWHPQFTDSSGRFLHDFSYAGYHRGEIPLPSPTGAQIDVTQPPYSADATGAKDSTAAIQAALDQAAKDGGSIVFLPSGTYRIAPPAGEKVALKITGDHTILRGAGADKTFLLNEEPVMREKTVIEIAQPKPTWWYAEGNYVKSSPATGDIPSGSTTIAVDDTSLFATGDLVIVRNDPTERFIEELGMTGKWTTQNMKGRGLAFCRTLLAVDPSAKTITIDVPTRYLLRKDDNARVVKLTGSMIREVGLEDFSLGMREHVGEGGDDEKVLNTPGTPDYEMHQSHAIVFNSAENCWMRRVNSFCPDGNTSGIHVLSNGIKLERSRFVTIEKCDWKNTQYKGGGGNGYLYTLHSEECLIRDCRAENGRHNYDLAMMYCSGNVILGCVTKDGRLASDFHMYFAVANLFDSTTCDGDTLEAKYRPYGGPPTHGVTTSQSVFWNTFGQRYASTPFVYAGATINRAQIIVQSRQFGDGYVIGTHGPASKVDSTNFVEGEGQDGLEPRSLYLDQLSRRLGKN
ncbi:hypothetical protein BH09VER1_BH09VER1_39800 [soil metagenome]